MISDFFVIFYPLLKNVLFLPSNVRFLGVILDPLPLNLNKIDARSFKHNNSALTF